LRHLEIRGLSSAYGKTEVLKDVSLSVDKGEVVSLIGPSGSGKSTISGLIARLYDVDSGRVLLDGIDVSELDPGWLRSQVTFVSQDSSFFSRTIKENILFGNLDASFLIANRGGIYMVSGDMSISRFEQYAAIGSGADYALGALYHLYDQERDAATIARKAVETAIQFNVHCGGDVQVVKV